MAQPRLTDDEIEKVRELIAEDAFRNKVWRMVRRFASWVAAVAFFLVATQDYVKKFLGALFK